MNAVVSLESRALAPSYGDSRMAVAEILENVTRVQQVMRSVMKPDVHYGVIPGTDKPTLLKPGAELLCMTFRISATYAVEDLSTEHVVRYRVTCTGTHQTSGTVLGTGMGEASSGEEKYKWVKAYREEWDTTPESMRRKKQGYNKQSREKYEVLQVRTDPANLANTILKMANKRAYLAMVLSVTAASDCFAQDLEDMEERLRQHLTGSGDEPAGQQEQQQERQQAAPTNAAASLPTWDDGQITKREAKISEFYSKGKTSDEIVSFYSTLATLSEAQKKRIRDLKPATTAAAPADADQVTDVAPKITYAAVADKIVHAMSLDVLSDAETLIGELADAQHRTDAIALAKDRRAYIEERAR